MEIVSTDLPELVVSPVLKLGPCNVKFNYPVTIILPLVLSPDPATPESECPELTLMRCRDGEWCKLESTKLSYEDVQFECNQFSAYCWTTDEDGNKKYVKRLTCLLYKGVPEGQQVELTVIICDDLPHIVKVMC